MTHSPSPGTTSVPLQKIPEGPACQVRMLTLDDRPQFTRILVEANHVRAIHELPLQRIVPLHVAAL